MRKNGFSPSPARRKRGPRSPLAGSTPTMIASAPLRRPSAPSRLSSVMSFCSIRSYGMVAPSCRCGSPGGLQPCPELLQHILGHRFDVLARGPIPFGARGAVIDRARPGIGDRLAHRIDVVIDAEIRKMLADLGGEAFRGE